MGERSNWTSSFFKKVHLKARAPKLNKQKEIPVLTSMKKLTKAFKILK